MAWLNGVIVAYALLSLGGGIAGYVSKGSFASVGAAIVTAALLLGGTALAKSNAGMGYGIVTFGTVATLGFFGMRYAQKGTVWPALVMVIASVVVLGCLVAGHFMKKPA